MLCVIQLRLGRTAGLRPTLARLSRLRGAGRLLLLLGGGVDMVLAIEDLHRRGQGAGLGKVASDKRSARKRASCLSRTGWLVEDRRLAKGCRLRRAGKLRQAASSHRARGRAVPSQRILAALCLVLGGGIETTVAGLVRVVVEGLRQRVRLQLRVARDRRRTRSSVVVLVVGTRGIVLARRLRVLVTFTDRLVGTRGLVVATHFGLLIAATVT